MNKIRIIAGSHRGRKIVVADIAGLRPTTDRIRETLFNWLDPYIQQRVCLDLFAGSGALSFEALSRGASKAIMVDANPTALKHLQQNSEQLAFDDVAIIKAKLPTALAIEKNSIDLVFLDPPFKQDLLVPMSHWLMEQGWLKPDSLIYVEAESTIDLAALPEEWELLKQKKTKTIYYGLYTLSLQSPIPSAVA